MTTKWIFGAQFTPQVAVSTSSRLRQKYEQVTISFADKQKIYIKFTLTLQNDFCETNTLSKNNFRLCISQCTYCI